MEEFKNKLLDDLLEADYSLEEAVELIKSVKHIPDGAYTADQASSVELQIRRYIPLEMLDKNYLSWKKEKQNKYLWELGFNTKKFNPMFVVGWFRYPEQSPRMVYDCFLVCSERVDKAWTSKIVEGVHIASEEARYFYMQNELHEIRGARGRAQRKKA